GRRVTARDFDGARVLILGYGLEGASSHRWLRAHARPARVTVADRSTVELVAPADAVFVGRESLTHLQDVDVILRAPGVPSSGAELVAARAAGVRVTSQTNLLLHDCGAQTIGVTGTKGKSTTSSLLAAMLAADGRDVRLVGNIGVPPLDEIPTATADTT